MTRAHTHQSNAAWPQAATRGAQPGLGQPGFAPIVDVDGELEFWRHHYDERALAAILPHARFSDVEPAIRVGIHAFLLAPSASFETLAPRLSNTYRRVRGGSCFSWYLAEGPCADAYARLQHAVLKPAIHSPAARPRAAAAEQRAQDLLERTAPPQRPTARDGTRRDLAMGGQPTDVMPTTPAFAATGSAHDRVGAGDEPGTPRVQAVDPSPAYERQRAPTPGGSTGRGDEALAIGDPAPPPLAARL